MLEPLAIAQGCAVELRVRVLVPRPIRVYVQYRVNTTKAPSLSPAAWGTRYCAALGRVLVGQHRPPQPSTVNGLFAELLNVLHFCLLHFYFLLYLLLYSIFELHFVHLGPVVHLEADIKHESTHVHTGWVQASASDCWDNEVHFLCHPSHHKASILYSVLIQFTNKGEADHNRVEQQPLQAHNVQDR